jgi:hypothetical protein
MNVFAIYFKVILIKITRPVDRLPTYWTNHHSGLTSCGPVILDHPSPDTIYMNRASVNDHVFFAESFRITLIINWHTALNTIHIRHAVIPPKYYSDTSSKTKISAPQTGHSINLNECPSLNVTP